ncbi:hypothetical protein F4Z99_18450 [Candidatus Poribacteria bacterium]|nr:hypothetical protein [Candidatus Poribacteria bacterium]MYB02589.1 hypothetical protein [Candidatus Poribacteria bacterium]
MANASDNFLLRVLKPPTENPEDPPIIGPYIRLGSSSQNVSVVSGKRYAVNYVYRVGSPAERAFSSEIVKAAGQPVASPATAADLTFTPAQAEIEYVDPQTGQTIPFGPEEDQNGGAYGVAPEVAENTNYDGTVRLGTPTL